MFVLHDLRVPDLVKIGAGEAQRVAPVSRIIAQGFENSFLAFERLMGVIGFQSQGTIRRFVPRGAVRGHVARTEGHDPVAGAASRFPGTRDVVARCRAGFRLRLYRRSPAVEKRGRGGSLLAVFR